MTEPELKAIEDRAAAATPGPWTEEGGSGGIRVEAAPADPDGFPQPIAEVPPLGPSANRIFIAATRTDVPTLVSEVRRLREVLREHADFLRAIERHMLRIGNEVKPEDVAKERADLLAALKEPRR